MGNKWEALNYGMVACFGSYDTGTNRQKQTDTSFIESQSIRKEKGLPAYCLSSKALFVNALSHVYRRFQLSLNMRKFLTELRRKILWYVLYTTIINKFWKTRRKILLSYWEYKRLRTFPCPANKINNQRHLGLPVTYTILCRAGYVSVVCIY